VLGVQGLAPYWFEVDAAAYVGERGRITGRFDASYELTLTQRLFAEPFVTVRASSKADPKLLEGSGLMDTEAGLRLRYEFSRRFAPYVGVSFVQRYGDTKRLLTGAGGDGQETSGRLGLRLLF
jgi:copper resistance protein B